MTITVLSPISAKHTDTKVAVDGKIIKKNHTEYPKHYTVIEEHKRDPNICELGTLYKILKQQEIDNSDWVIFFEHLITDKKECVTACKKSLAENINRYVIQLDVDLDVKGTNANSLEIEERYEIFKQHFPFLEGVKCVLQLSNKAGYTEHYPDRLALRVYIELDKFRDNKTLKVQLKPYSDVIDTNIYTQGRKHLTQRPHHIGDHKPKEFKRRTLLIDGDVFDYTGFINSPEHTRKKAEFNQLETINKKITSNLENGLELDNITEIDDLVDTGYFEKVPRHGAHHNMIARNVWKGQNGEKVVELILGNDAIRGSKTREDLERQLQSIHTKNYNYFEKDITLKDFDYKLEVCEKELSNADLSGLEVLIKEHIEKDIPLILICKSPHGSGKTMALIKMVLDALKKELQEDPRFLYLSGTRSVLKSTHNKLKEVIPNLECYLDEDGDTVNKFNIQTARQLDCGLNSIHHLTHVRGDIVAIDESEEAALWADWHVSTFHNQLIKIMANHKICLLLDADASDGTYSLATRAQQYSTANLTLLHNSGAWINGEMATMVKSELQAYEIALEESKKNLVYLHTDLAKEQLKARIEAFNAHENKQIAVGFCSKKGCTITKEQDPSMEGAKGLRRLQERPEETIDYLVEQGYRIIALSPVIQNGWRCNSKKNRNWVGVGYYEYTFSTARKILQKTLRFVGLKKHYFCIPPTSFYVNPDDYEQQITHELNQSVYGGTENASDNEFRHNKELEAEAKLIKTIYESNPKLHFIYVWESYGGKVENYISPTNETNEKLRGLLKDIKKHQKEERARSILGNEESVERLNELFKVLYGDLYIGNPTLEKVIELTEILDNYQLRKAEIDKIIEALHATEDECRNWDIFGRTTEDFLKNATEPQKLERSLLNNDGFYLSTFYLMSHIENELYNQQNLSLKKIFDIGKEKRFAINFEDIAKGEYAKQFNAYRNLYTTELGNISKYKDPRKFLKQVIEKVFHCKVKYGVPTAKKVSDVKNRLIRHYQKNNIAGIKQTKDTKPSKNEPLAIEHLKNKVQRKEQLHWIEKDYLQHSGKILVIDLPQIIPQEIYETHKDKSKVATSETVLEAI